MPPPPRFHFRFRPVGGGWAGGAPREGIPGPSHQVSPETHGPFRRPGRGGQQPRSLREAGPRRLCSWRLARPGGPGGRRRDEPSPRVPPWTAQSERPPPGPPDLASACTPRCPGSAGNPDLSLGIRRESGLRAGPRFAGASGLRDIARRALAIGVLALDPGMGSWAGPPYPVGDARLLLSGGQLWPRAFV